MDRSLSSFLIVAVLTLALAAIGFGLQQKGYAFGALGIDRLEGLAGPASFMPLAALYAFSAALIMVMPLRAAGVLHAGAATPVFTATIVLLATIVGLVAARVIFSGPGILATLVDWRFLFAAAIVAAHVYLDAFRRNVLLRTVFFIAFTAATLACLFWNFRL
jgi:hypothetical protein